MITVYFIKTDIGMQFLRVKTNSTFRRIKYLHIPPAHDKFSERHYSVTELFLVLFFQSQIHHGHQTLTRKKKVTL